MPVKAVAINKVVKVTGEKKKTFCKTLSTEKKFLYRPMRVATLTENIFRKGCKCYYSSRNSLQICSNCGRSSVKAAAISGSKSTPLPSAIILKH